MLKRSEIPTKNKLAVKKLWTRFEKGCGENVWRGWPRPVQERILIMSDFGKPSTKFMHIGSVNGIGQYCNCNIGLSEYWINPILVYQVPHCLYWLFSFSWPGIKADLVLSLQCLKIFISMLSKPCHYKSCFFLTNDTLLPQ